MSSREITVVCCGMSSMRVSLRLAEIVTALSSLVSDDAVTAKVVPIPTMKEAADIALRKVGGLELISDMTRWLFAGG